VLVPALLGWPYARLAAELRKGFEVALHAGTALALTIALRAEVAGVVRELDARRALGAALALVPTAAAGSLLERPIEARLGAPWQVAIAQMVGGVALAAADRAPATRRYEDAGVLDHLVLGLAQALALVPGVSRNGATMSAARARRLDRAAASRLSRHAALPVIVGASGLKGGRLLRAGLPSALRPPFAVGFAAAALSTLAARGPLGLMAGARSYVPLGAYRVVLGAFACARLRRTRSRTAASAARFASMVS